MKGIKLLPKVSFKNLSKVNNKPNSHRCNNCLELSRFNVFTANRVNMLGCVLCLKSCRYNKTLPLHKHSIIRTSKLSLKDIIKRQFKRIKKYIIGDHVKGPFGRRRKK